MFTSNDLLDKSGTSQSALTSAIDIIQKFPASTIHLVVLHPLQERFEWTDIPTGAKTFAEMRTYGLAKKEDVYDIYDVSKSEGLVAVIRPDGYVGMLAPLSRHEPVEDYFRGCLVSI